MLVNRSSSPNVREWDLDKKRASMKEFNFFFLFENIDLGWEAYKLGHMPGENFLHQM